jgi:adenosine deaminase CECR1
MRLHLLLGAVVVTAGCAAHSHPGVSDRSRPAPGSAPSSIISTEPGGNADVAAYHQARERLIAEERALRLGAGLVLTADEEAANRRLLALKQEEFARTRTYFPPAQSFLRERTKRLIAESPVFAVMKRLPKGAILHAHGGAMGDFRWLVSRVTSRPDCYVYVGPGPTPDRGALRIAAQSPGGGWRLVSELRAAAPDAKVFDDELFRSITLGEEDLERDDVWEEFSAIFRRISGLWTDRTLLAEHWRTTLEGVIAENVQYMESRTGPIDEAIIREVRGRDPSFDMKFIPVAGRSVTRERLSQILKAVVDMRVKDPERVKGFDLVQEEDRTNTNLFYVEQLLAARRDAEQRGVALPLFLHSGESNWVENENLYDAILLGASRIGHGTTLINHPLLMNIVRTRGIAVEVCPTSNQILGYVQDLRAHPAVHYINAGLPIVLSPDDAGIMRNSLSHDFYAAFMAWGLDLRSLKQLAMNSLVYSAMNADEKRRAIAEWERRWSAFIAWINARSAVPADGVMQP